MFSQRTVPVEVRLKCQHPTPRASSPWVFRILLAILWLLLGEVGCRHADRSRTVVEGTTVDRGEQRPPGVELYMVDTTQPYGARETYWVCRHPRGYEVRHGPAVSYYRDGTKQMEANFKHGLAHGRVVHFSMSGEKVIEGVFRNGKPWDGECAYMDTVWEYKKGRAIRRVDLNASKGR